MHFSAVALTIAAAAFGSASASAAASRALVSVNQASSSLLSRQVAAACVSICTPVQNAETTCVTASCMCSPTFASELSDCSNCRVQNDPTLLSELEAAWDEYSSGCATLGLTVSGGIDDGTSTPAVSSTAPAVSTTSAASSSDSTYDGLVAHANAAPNLQAGGALGLLLVGVVAVLL
ncbi:hypothetical protein FRC04_011295 [Tulasnella sp. 424]|nr:hypothetical protein FRC04_011295 [Tulasnella sp. 424]KAG8971831.1 hypothetical protein FRC05_010792 [Tulasnella sp. 425]